MNLKLNTQTPILKTSLLLIGIVIMLMLGTEQQTNVQATSGSTWARTPATFGRAATENGSWCPSEDYIATYATYAVWIYDDKLNDVTNIIPPAFRPIKDLLWHPSCELMMTYSASMAPGNGNVDVWQVDLSTETFVHIQTIDVEHGPPSDFTHPISWNPASSATEAEFAIVNGTADGINIWEMTNGTFSLHDQISASDGTISLSWNPIGTTIATVDVSGNIEAVVVGGGAQPVFSINIEDSRSPLEWSPDATQLAVTTRDGAIVIIDASSGNIQQMLIGHTFVSSLDWSTFGLASAGDDARIWDVDAGTVITQFTTAQILGSDVSWNSDNTSLYSAEGNFIQIWDVASRSTEYFSLQHTYGIDDVTWFPDGTRLATSSGVFENDFYYIWTNTGEPIDRVPHPTGDIVHVAWRADGTQIATSDRSEQISIWNAQTNQILHEIIVMGGELDWHPSDHRLLAYEDGLEPETRVIDTITGNELLDLSATLKSPVWSPQGHTIAGIDPDRESSIVVVDATTGESLYNLNLDREVTIVALGGDESTLIAGTDAGTVQFWDVETGSVTNSVEISTPERVELLARNPVQDIFVASGFPGASLSEDSLVFFDSTGTILQTTDSRGATFEKFQWSPDGTQLASIEGAALYTWRLYDYPTAPSSFNIPSQFSNEITLEWMDNATDETAFHIERAPDDGTGNPGTFAEIGTVPADTTTFTDTESLACGMYYYRVRAFRADDSLFSDYSNTASVEIPCGPIAPTAIAMAYTCTPRRVSTHQSGMLPHVASYRSGQMAMLCHGELKLL